MTIFNMLLRHELIALIFYRSWEIGGKYHLHHHWSAGAFKFHNTNLRRNVDELFHDCLIISVELLFLCVNSVANLNKGGDCISINLNSTKREVVVQSRRKRCMICFVLFYCLYFSCLPWVLTIIKDFCCDINLCFPDVFFYCWEKKLRLENEHGVCLSK